MKDFKQDILYPLVSFLAMVLFICANARAAEFSVPFKPLRPVNAFLEGAWQGENVIDLQQTLRIAKNPERWREVGTLAMTCGNHPSVRQVWIGSIAYGIAHYAVSQVLENYGMTKTLAVWQVTSLGAKTWNMNRNVEQGLGY